MLIAEGFGMEGKEHDIVISSHSGRKYTRKSRLWLFPGQAQRIYNTDETNITSFATHTNRSNIVSSPNVATPVVHDARSSVHITYCGICYAPEYARPATTIEKDGREIKIDAVKARDAGVLPGMVCFQIYNYE